MKKWIEYKYRIHKSRWIIVDCTTRKDKKKLHSKCFADNYFEAIMIIDIQYCMNCVTERVGNETEKRKKEFLMEIALCG